MKWLLLGLGGALGTLARYGLSQVPAPRLLGEASEWFPYGTFLANAAGSALLGFFAITLGTRAFPGTDVPLALVLGTGMMGGFTTYSTFNLESLGLVQAGEPLRALTYVGVTLVICLVGALLGGLVGQLLVGR